MVGLHTRRPRGHGHERLCARGSRHRARGRHRGRCARLPPAALLGRTAMTKAQRVHEIAPRDGRPPMRRLGRLHAGTGAGDDFPAGRPFFGDFSLMRGCNSAGCTPVCAVLSGRVVGYRGYIGAMPRRSLRGRAGGSPLGFMDAWSTPAFMVSRISLLPTLCRLSVHLMQNAYAL